MHDGFYAATVKDKPCKACVAALNSFAPDRRDDLVRVYTHPEGVHAGIRRVCMDKHVPADSMWSIVNQYERKVARLIIIEED